MDPARVNSALPDHAEMLSFSDRAPTCPLASYFNGTPEPDGVTVTLPVSLSHFIDSDDN